MSTTNVPATPSFHQPITMVHFSPIPPASDDFIVQVAGCRSADEAHMLAAAGVNWIGFPLRLDVHAEDVSEAEATRIIGTLPAGVKGVLITYEPSALRIRSLARSLGVRIVQIHGEMPLDELKQLRCLAPDLRVIKSIVLGAPEWDEPIARMRRFLPFVHGFITDTFDPVSGARGATGKLHDWRISRKLVEESPKPVILAGGLTPENVVAAVRAVRPAGVDCHTGVEQADGAKSPRLVQRFRTRACTTATRMKQHLDLQF